MNKKDCLWSCRPKCTRNNFTRGKNQWYEVWV